MNIVSGLSPPVYIYNLNHPRPSIDTSLHPSDTDIYTYRETETDTQDPDEESRYTMITCCSGSPERPRRPPESLVTATKFDNLNGTAAGPVDTRELTDTKLTNLTTNLTNLTDNSHIENRDSFKYIYTYKQGNINSNSNSKHIHMYNYTAKELSQSSIDFTPLLPQSPHDHQ